MTLQRKWTNSLFSLLLCLPFTLAFAGGEYVTYLHSDIQGSPIMATDEQGNVVWQEDYEPWGARQVKDTASASAARGSKVWYTGKEEEANLGLYYYGARWYSPDIGQFTAIDPVSVRIGNPRTFNRYAYANNNPVMRVDPDGRDARIVVNGSSIKISTTIYIYGSGATQQVANAYQQAIMSDWNRGWSYTHSGTGKTFNVNFDVSVKPYNQSSSTSDPLVIPESWNPMNTDNFIRVDRASKRSYVTLGDEGEWRAQGRGGRSLSADNPASHEFGHLVGLADRYDDINGTSPGWHGNVMGEPAGMGAVQQKNINSILDHSMGGYRGQQHYQTKTDESHPQW